MEPISVVIIDIKGLAKDPHPMGVLPIKPFEGDNKEKYEKDLKTFEETLLKWNEVDTTLKIYTITQMKTDAGQILENMNVLHWHIGKKYNAILLDSNSIQII